MSNTHREYDPSETTILINAADIRDMGAGMYGLDLYQAPYNERSRTIVSKGYRFILHEDALKAIHNSIDLKLLIAKNKKG